MIEATASGLRLLGERVIGGIMRLGYGGRFFGLVLLRSATSFRTGHSNPEGLGASIMLRRKSNESWFILPPLVPFSH